MRRRSWTECTLLSPPPPPLPLRPPGGPLPLSDDGGWKANDEAKYRPSPLKQRKDGAFSKRSMAAVHVRSRVLQMLTTVSSADSAMRLREPSTARASAEPEYAPTLCSVCSRNRGSEV